MSEDFESFGSSTSITLTPPPLASLPPPDPAPQTLNLGPGIEKIALALSKAQGAIRSAEMTGMNPHFEKPYATLSDCWDAARPHLAANELAVVQMSKNLPTGEIAITTLLVHSSGQKFHTTIALKPARNDPQGIGSVITYGRRYGFNLIVGIAQDEAEDDGESAVGRAQKKSSPGRDPAREEGPPVVTPKPKPAVAPVPGPNDPPTSSQYGTLYGNAGKRGWSKEQIGGYVNTRWGYTSGKQLNQGQFLELLDAVQTMDPNAAMALAARLRATGGAVRPEGQ